MNREDMVQAALTVERWCEEHFSAVCDCPFACKGGACVLNDLQYPKRWHLAEFLRNRGMKHENEDEDAGG